MNYKFNSHKSEVIEEMIYPEKSSDNSFPIILIAGFTGSTMDENALIQGYFHYAFDRASRQYTKDITGGAVQHIYEADVSPLGSAHDRTCELW